AGVAVAPREHPRLAVRRPRGQGRAHPAGGVLASAAAGAALRRGGLPEGGGRPGPPDAPGRRLLGPARGGAEVSRILRQGGRSLLGRGGAVGAAGPHAPGRSGRPAPPRVGRARDPVQDEGRRPRRVARLPAPPGPRPGDRPVPAGAPPPPPAGRGRADRDLSGARADESVPEVAGPAFHARLPRRDRLPAGGPAAGPDPRSVLRVAARAGSPLAPAHTRPAGPRGAGAALRGTGRLRRLVLAQARDRRRADGTAGRAPPRLAVAGRRLELRQAAGREAFLAPRNVDPDPRARAARPAPEGPALAGRRRAGGRGPAPQEAVPRGAQREGDRPEVHAAAVPALLPLQPPRGPEGAGRGRLRPRSPLRRGARPAGVQAPGGRRIPPGREESRDVPG